MNLFYLEMVPTLKDTMGNTRLDMQYQWYSLVSVLKSVPLPEIHSAWQAELKALTKACQLAKGATANIYANRQYAFGVAHDFRKL